MTRIKPNTPLTNTGYDKKQNIEIRGHPDHGEAGELVVLSVNQWIEEDQRKIIVDAILEAFGEKGFIKE